MSSKRLPSMLSNLLVLCSLLVLSVAAAEPPKSRRPLVVAVSGGGFTSMTGGMALVRALRHLNGKDELSSVTHIGGNSGGSFFGNQFLHSKAFFDNVTNANLPMDTLVTDWLAKYVAALKGLMKKDGPLQEKFGSVALVSPEPGCAALNVIQQDVVFAGLSNAAKYPLRWLPAVSAAVISNSLGDDMASSATYADVSHTLPNVTLISQITLPPDAWTSRSHDTKYTNIATLHATMKDGREINFAENVQALPVAFVSKGPESHGWFYNEDIANLSLVPKCPYKGLFHECRCKKFPSDRVPLPLPEHPLISEVTAASGGSTGFAGSPTVYGQIANKFVKAVTKGPGALLEPVLSKVVDCWPYGAQVLSPPMMRPKTTVAQSETDVPFRYMDGGYAENTALPMSLAKAQQDCRSPSSDLDCTEPIQLILVNDGNISSHHTGFGSVSAKDSLRSLFFDPETPVGTFVPGMAGSIKVPAQTIFAESFPNISEWRQYNDFPSKHCAGFPLNCLRKGHGEWVEQNIKSMQWSGILTTVENKHFGVIGGQKVHLLIFSLEIPGLIWPGLGDPAQTHIVKPGHLRIADGAVMEDPEFISGHAPMAKAQAAAFVPVLEEFLHPSKIASV